MIRHNYSIAALLLATLSLGAWAQSSVGAVITLQGAGPYHRLVLPAAVYQDTAFADLRDLRIVNAGGLAVPYAWLRHEGPAPQTASGKVPLFAVPATAAQSAPTDALLAFKVRTDGSLVLSKPAGNARAPSSDWLMDASQIKGRLLQAHFTVVSGTQGIFAFYLEASDDLRQWRTLAGSAPEQLVVLQQGTQRVERLTVDLHSVQTKFLRLRWLEPQHSAALISTSIDSVQDTWPEPALEWSEPLQAQDCAADHCDYVLPRGVPVHSLRFQLSQTNTLAPLGIAGVKPPATAAAPHHAVVHNPLYALRRARQQAHTPAAPQEVNLLNAVVYRLSLEGKEVLSPVLPLDGGVYSRLRVYTQGAFTALGTTPPTLEIATPQRSLVFLAQGAAPFNVQWSQAPAGAALGLATVLPGYANNGLPTLNTATLSITSTPAPAAAASGAGQKAPVTNTRHGRKMWLWGALLLGLALLAAMAVSLLRSLKPSPAQTSSPKL